MSNGANSKESFGAIILDGAGKYLKARASMIVCGILIGILGISIVIVASILVPPKYTQITSIAEYGNYSGTENEQIPRQIISSFFPEKIEPYFSDVVYSYKAENIDYYGFEAYLEFRIDDEEEFYRFIDRIKKNRKWNQFLFDESFVVCSLSNELNLNYDEATDSTSPFYIQIIRANVQQILYSVESQTIIYVAMGVRDGGGVGTNYLNMFFDRFDIDPLEYEKTAESPYEEKKVD